MLFRILGSTKKLKIESITFNEERWDLKENFNNLYPKERGKYVCEKNTDKAQNKMVERTPKLVVTKINSKD